MNLQVFKGKLSTLSNSDLVASKLLVNDYFQSLTIQTPENERQGIIDEHEEIKKAIEEAIDNRVNDLLDNNY